MGRIAETLRTIPGARLDPGWETRGGTWADPDRVIGVIVHHTASAIAGGAFASLPLCRNGRGGANPVPGPLCNIHIARNGVVTVLAGEKANHAGEGSSVVLRELERGVAPTGDAKARGLVDDATASGRTIGIEVEHLGTSAEAWGEQIPALIGVLRHLVERLDLAGAQVIGHREWTRRKIDPVYGPGLESMSALRAALPLPPAVPHVPPPITEDHPLLSAGPVVTVDQAVAFLERNRPVDANGYTRKDLEKICWAYSATAKLAGIPLAVFVAQLAHETGFLTSEWSARPRRNPAGVGVIGGPSGIVVAPRDQPPTRLLPANHSWQWIESRPGRPADRWESGVTFPTWAPDAVDAHVGRLAAYCVAAGNETHQQARLIDIAGRWRPIPLAVRGCARTLAELGAARNPRGIGWANPGTDYGARLAEHINRMRAR